MFLILPILAYILLLLISGMVYATRREAALVAATWWTFLVVALTEVLSIAHAITRPGLALGWFCAVATVAVFAAALWRKRARAVVVPRSDLSTSASRLSRPEWLMIAGAVFICALVGITAIVSPPNGSDQLQYHLPRVVEWASRRSVLFFPTHYYVQLFAPPLAEWTMLHSYVLTGGDRFVGLVQWLAFVCSAIGVSLIARELGANLKGQILAAFLCVTLPQGILAASGAKNDWVLACWMTAVVFFLIRWFRAPGWLTTCNLGLAAGAALLSKGSVYAFLPPIVVALSVWALRSQWKTALKRAPVTLALILVMNGPQWARNHSLGGSILGLTAPDVAGKEKYSVDRITLRGAASNVLREAAMHLATPVDAFNQRATNIVRGLISHLGVNPDDGAYTNYSNFEIPRQYFLHDEYYAGNPLHLVLALFAFAAVFFVWRGMQAGAAALALGIIGGFVLYCSLFKWEIWCARLHLPLFVIAGAVIAVVVCQRFPRLTVPVVVISLISAIPSALCNSSRPILYSGGFREGLHNRTSIFLQSRSALYFTQQRELKDSYLAASEIVKQERCEDVGMDTSVKPYSHEYPLMELSQDASHGVKFRYVDVHNLSSKYADQSDLATPCVVICPDCRDQKEKWDEYLPGLPTTHVFGDLVVFGRTPPSEARLSREGK